MNRLADCQRQTDVLESLGNMTGDITPIAVSEFRDRLERLQAAMQGAGVDAIYLNASTNLYYFTGLKWSPSERMVAAIIPASGTPCYIAPQFELDTLRDYWQIPAEIHAWEEHECPYDLAARVLHDTVGESKTIGIDEATPYFILNGLQRALPKYTFQSAQPLTQSIRSRKTEAELSLIRRAHEMTLAVHAKVKEILQPGISTTEVESFINQAHKRVGAAGSSFCIVLFGVATSFPHGVKEPQILKENDWVLVDTGCLLDGYHSDITRTYTFGAATDRQIEIWNIERDAQFAAFAAAKLGEPCEACDAAARKVLEAAGLGPGYSLPGLPHRTGHGCGLDIHEGPNLVKGETEPMDVGMVFSNEPMIVVPGEFGCRLEDHFYMTADGPVWLTEPAKSPENPF